jgi:hypothetical protein
MPIYAGLADGAMVAHFGVGDLVVALGVENGDEAGAKELVVFEDKAVHPIGEFRPDLSGETTADLKHPIRFFFENIESLDVVIERLQELRSRFEARQTPKTEPGESLFKKRRVSGDKYNPRDIAILGGDPSL